MKLPATRETLWRSRSRALLKAWPGVASEDQDALHEARVATRRIREALPILIAGHPSRLKKLRRRIRRITRALGPVREVDVALALLTEIEHTRPSARVGVELVRARLLAERAERRDAMQSRLDRVDVKKIARRIAASLGEPGARQSGRRRGANLADPASWTTVLAARIVRRAEALRIAVEKAGSIYLPDRLHAVRVAVKKLRYAVELVREVQRARTSAAIRRLKHAQDALGQLHDLEVLTDHARKAQASLGAGEHAAADEIGSLVRLLEGQCRELHAEYVSVRGHLLELCEASADYLAGALSIPRPRVVRVTSSRGVSSNSKRSTAADRGPRGVRTERNVTHGVDH